MADERDRQSGARRANARVAGITALVVVGMVGASFAAVPAYRAFCQATGWGGFTQRADAGADQVLDRKITVRFDGTTAGVPWRFKPEQLSQTLRVGETGLAFYEAENLSDHPIVGQATFNVQPAKAGYYFRKIDCFCFTEQLLEPGQKVSMPVTYFIDPEIAEEPGLDDVSVVTLSYTFFEKPGVEAPAAGGAE